MDKFFIEILNLSFTGSFIILAVILLRFIFKKAPKYLSLTFWALVFIKLLCPIKFESRLSLVPSSTVIPQNIVYAQNPNITSGITVIDNSVNPVLESSMSPTLGNSVNPMQIVMYIASNIWVLGVAAMLIYTLVSYILLKRKVRASINAYENVYYCDYIESPFVLGIIKPKIYLPSGISEKEAELVILHEKAHIKRLDHISKFIGFIPLAVHWLNPLVWLSYHLFSKDIEAAADELVIENKELSFKKDYSETLLSLSNKRKVLVCPLAFGEIGVKQRVKNILSFKKPTIWIIIAVIFSAVVLAILFIPSPKEKNNSSIGIIGGSDGPTEIYFSADTPYDDKMHVLRKIYPEYFDLNTENGLTVYVWQISERGYYCGILEGQPENHKKSDVENLQGAGFVEIKAILTSYNIKKENITVVPYKMPYSSYYYEITPEYKEWIEAKLELTDNIISDTDTEQYSVTRYDNGNIKTETTVSGGNKTVNYYRENGVIEKSMLYGIDGSSFERQYNLNGIVYMEINIDPSGNIEEATYKDDGYISKLLKLNIDGSYLVYVYNEYGEAVLREQGTNLDDGKFKREYFSENGIINRVSITGPGFQRTDIYYDNYGNVLSENSNVPEVKDEDRLSIDNWYEGLTLSVRLLPDTKKYKNCIELTYNMSDSLRLLSPIIKADNKAKLEIYLDGEWVDYGKYVNKQSGYVELVSDKYGSKEIYLDTGSNAIGTMADFNTCYGDLIPGAYKISKIIDKTDWDGTNADKHEFSTIFTVTDKEILENLSKFINDDRFIYETEIAINKDLKGEIIKTTYGSGGFTVGLKHYVDDSFELQIKYGNEWVDYERYMEFMNFDYEKLKKTNENNIYELDYKTVLVKGEWEANELRIPFDIGSVYGNLIPGNYRVIKEVSYKLSNNETKTDLIAGTFAVLG